MLLDFTDTLYALSFALDAVEKEFNGVMQGHGKRVACMSERMAKQAGFSDAERTDLAGVAVLHDNSIIEFLDSVDGNEHYRDLRGLGGHCLRGEARIRLLPFTTDVSNAILYHHECANGMGPFGKTADETPLTAQIIHLADAVDTHFQLTHLGADQFDRISRYVHQEEGRQFSPEVVSLFDRAFTAGCIDEIDTKGVDYCLRTNVPTVMEELSRDQINGITEFFSAIIDFKSSFTRAHSMGVASKAEEMAQFYGWDRTKTDRYFFAGAMHDIGKLVITNDILEKPDKLTGAEYSQMKNHAAATYQILHPILGMEDITQWAANHHEKLDGTGYPRGLKAEEQTFEDRLMACIDIYQALTETRPYKEGLPHSRAIGMMRDMAAQGKIDAGITEDLDKVYGSGSPEFPDLAPSQPNAPRWRCPVCGYIYEGETPPEHCPVCDMPGSNYVRMQ